MSKKRHTAADEPFFTIRSLASSFPSGARLETHAHQWHQLVYAATGVMTVWTEEGTWVAPPQWAIWVPRQVPHRIAFSGQSQLRTLYVRPRWGGIPQRCTVVTVSPLLRELISRTMALGMLDRRVPTQLAMAQLIFAELEQREVAPFDLPRPTGELTRRIAQALEAHDSNAQTVVIARQFGVSARTLERRFLEETGLSFGRWRRQVRLLAALRALAAGASVKEVAHRSGYSEPSAFIAAFRATFGETPGRYFDEA